MRLGQAECLTHGMTAGVLRRLYQTFTLNRSFTFVKAVFTVVFTLAPDTEGEDEPNLPEDSYPPKQ